MPELKVPAAQFRAWRVAAAGLWALTALFTGSAVLLLLLAFPNEPVPVLLIVPVLVGAALLVARIARGLPGAAVVAGPAGLVIRFSYAINTALPWSSIESARPRRHPFRAGLGIRTNFRGCVALATAWGPALELQLARPVPVTLIPGLPPIAARSLVLTIADPARFAAAIEPRLTAYRRS